MTMPEELSLGEPAPRPRRRHRSAPPTRHPAEPAAPAIDPPVVSIVDTILQLDAYMSGDVRRAEKTARFCSKPWLEADIDELVFELQGLVDELGNPLPAGRARHRRAGADPGAGGAGDPDAAGRDGRRVRLGADGAAALG
jgi:hypothetical protein